MPRINSDVASITVGGVSSSGLRTSRNNSGLAPSSSRGTNSSERSTAYTTKSGYSLSTSFKDNIKWKRKKEPLKPSPSIDSVSTYQDSSATSSSGDGGGGGGSETDSSTGGTGQYSPNQVRSDVKKKSWRSLPKPDREQSNSLHDGVVEKRDLKGQRAALSSSSSNFYYNNSYANSYSNINTMLERKSPPIIITNSSSSDDISATVGDDANSSSTNNTSFQPKQLKTKFSFFKSLRSRKAPPDSLDLSAASPNNFDEYPKSAMTALSTQFHNDPDCLYPVFARPLEDAMNLNVPFESTDILSKVDSIDETICEVEYQKYIPLILFKCVKFITRYGLDEEGLYRVSGSSSDVQRLKKRFQNEGPVFDIDPESVEVHTVASLLKSYLRELPGEILPVERHEFLKYTPASMGAAWDASHTPPQLQSASGEFVNYMNNTATNSNPTNDNSPTDNNDNDNNNNGPIDPLRIPLQVLQDELCRLPYCNFALVHLLVRHFTMVVDHSTSNLMNPNNLAVIFCPTLKISKPLFIALISNGESLWKDLHPQTPRPEYHKTHNSSVPLGDNEINRGGKHDDAGYVLDSITASTDDTPSSNSQPIGFGISIPTNENTEGSAYGPLIGRHQKSNRGNNDKNNNKLNNVRGNAFSDRLSGNRSLSSSHSTSRSSNSLEEDFETESTEAEYPLDPPPLVHDYNAGNKLSIDVEKSNNSIRSTKSGRSNKSGRSPRALFLRPSTPNVSSFSQSAPGTPTT